MLLKGYKLLESPIKKIGAPSSLIYEYIKQGLNEQQIRESALNVGVIVTREDFDNAYSRLENEKKETEVSKNEDEENEL